VLRKHSRLSNPLPDEVADSDPAFDHDAVRWKQFFGVKQGRADSNKQKRNSSYDSSTIRRILPDLRHIPTLVTAKTILTSSMDVDDISIHDGDSLDFASRPASSFGFPAHLSPDQSLDVSTELDSQTVNSSIPASPEIGGPVEHPVVAAVPRRSLSFRDLLSRSSSRKSSSQKLGSKLVKRGRRVVSAPIGTETAEADPDTERPSKRRDIQDPSIFRKEGDASERARQVPSDTPTPTGLQAIPPSNVAQDPASQASMATSAEPTSSSVRPLREPHSHSRSLSYSPVLPQGHPRASTVSAAPSEPASTLASSDNEASRGMNSIDDEDTDPSTLYDSLRTRGTRSTSGQQRAHIDTIFDESPSPPSSKGRKLRDILPEGALARPDFPMKDHYSTIEEEDSLATPVRTIRSDRADDGSPTLTRARVRGAIPLALTARDMPTALSLGTLEYDDQPIEDDDESRWSAFDEDTQMSVAEDWDISGIDLESSPSADKHGNPPTASGASSPLPPVRSHSHDEVGKDDRRDTRSQLFNWSEQPTEQSSGSRSPPRPRTVHGKKDTTDRCRSISRRPISGLHARSQSLPVVPDVASTRETLMTNKFGTWGVGSKGVSEKWDEDFDFPEEPEDAAGPANREERRIDSGVGVHIPTTIREQQAKVVTNITLVREFGMLVEELKVLKARITDRGLVLSDDTDLWDGVDAMIHLADQESKDPLFLPKPSRPSSPTADFDMSFEDSAEPSSSRTPQTSTPLPSRSRSRRRSVLPSENDPFQTPSSQAASSLALGSSPVAALTPVLNRPRKDSEAMARSVIEALQRRKDNPSAPITLKPVEANKKVPFDTSTLRHIVPHVSELVRRVKSFLRHADEGQDSSFASSSADPLPLSRLFDDPAATTPTRRNRHRPSRGDQDDDLSKSMKQMNLM
jgi:hypothetical protein